MLPTILNQNNFEHIQKIVGYIEDLIIEENKHDIEKIFMNFHPANCALILQFLKKSERKKILEILETNFNPEILSFLDEYVRDELMEFWANNQLAEMLNKLDTQDTIEIIENLSTEQLKALMPAFHPKIRKLLEKGLSYPENTIGRIMEYQVISTPVDWNIGQIKNFLKTAKKLPENLTEIFLISKEGFPIGKLLLINLIKLEKTDLARDYMEKIEIMLNHLISIDDAIYSFRTYSLSSAPIINDNNHLIGIVYISTILELVHEKAQEDLLHSAGVIESDFYDNLLHTSYKRIQWLFVSVFGALGVGMLIDTCIYHRELLGLLTIITSTSSASGVQVVTIIISALLNRKLGQVNLKRSIIKEVIVAILNSLFFGIIIGLILYFFKYKISLIIILIFVLSLSMIFSALIATILPFCLYKVKIDPTLSSSAILNSITDAISVTIFIIISNLLLKNFN